MDFKKLRKVLLTMGVMTCLSLPMVACGGNDNEGNGGGTNVEQMPEKLGDVVLTVDENGLATWEEVEGATSYDVYRKGYKDTSVFELVDTVTENTYKSVGVTTGKTYSYYVVAKNNVDDSRGDAVLLGGV